MCVVWDARLFGVLRENPLCAHDITYAGHYEKSLCSDNDLRYYSREIKIISSDWITLLRRLLVMYRYGSPMSISTKISTNLLRMNVSISYKFEKYSERA